MKKSAHQCSGIRTSWPWSGYRCGSNGKYQVGEKWYCGTHLAAHVWRPEPKAEKPA